MKRTEENIRKMHDYNGARERARAGLSGGRLRRGPRAPRRWRRRRLRLAEKQKQAVMQAKKKAAPAAPAAKDKGGAGAHAAEDTDAGTLAALAAAPSTRSHTHGPPRVCGRRPRGRPRGQAGQGCQGWDRGAVPQRRALTAADALAPRARAGLGSG